MTSDTAQTVASSFDARDFRRALGGFATGVTIITTFSADGTPVGITANSFSSVSLDPPLILFILARRAFSLGAFQRARGFAVHVLSTDQGDLSNRFAAASPHKFEGTGYRASEAGCPVIGGALATFECVTEVTHEGGDHVILIGRVVKFSRASEGDPLLFFQGAYRRLAPADDGYAERKAGSVLPPLTCLDPWFSG